MGEVARCVHCQRPFAAHFATCPHCHGAQPARAAKAQPIKCAVCQRPYNPALPECPFCAREKAHGSYREAPPPALSDAHASFQAARARIEADEAAGRALHLKLGAGVALGALLALAVGQTVHPIASGHLGVIGAFGLAAGAVCALLAPPFVALDEPSIGQRGALLGAGWIAGASLAYLVFALLLTTTAGPPVHVRCNVTSHGYAKGARNTPATTRFYCPLADGSALSGSDAHGALPFEVGAPFSLDARRSIVGWSYDPTTARALLAPTPATTSTITPLPTSRPHGP